MPDSPRTATSCTRERCSTTIHRRGGSHLHVNSQLTQTAILQRSPISITYPVPGLSEAEQILYPVRTDNSIYIVTRIYCRTIDSPLMRPHTYSELSKKNFQHFLLKKAVLKIGIGVVSGDGSSLFHLSSIINTHTYTHTPQWWPLTHEYIRTHARTHALISKSSPFPHQSNRTGAIAQKTIPMHLCH